MSAGDVGHLGNGGIIGLCHRVQLQRGRINIIGPPCPEKQVRFDDPRRPGHIPGLCLVVHQGRFVDGLISTPSGQQPPNGLVGCIVVLRENDIGPVDPDRPDCLGETFFPFLLPGRPVVAVVVAVASAAVLVVTENGGEGGNLPPVTEQIDRHDRKSRHAPNASQGQILRFVHHVGGQRGVGTGRRGRRPARCRTGVRVSVAVMGVGLGVSCHGRRSAVGGDSG
mmetsp:Transcript_11461/g.23477  ORF Transcript_11461/g.23477 Transcript_11461/m.23477 type:complete len:224 (-) Transcript_11461:235-906(-)